MPQDRCLIRYSRVNKQDILELGERSSKSELLIGFMSRWLYDTDMSKNECLDFSFSHQFKIPILYLFFFF